MPDIAHSPVVPRPTQKPAPRPRPVDPNWAGIKVKVDANNTAIQAILVQLNGIRSEPGPPGPTGSDGLAGVAGPQGAKGETGQPGRDVNDLTETELATLARRVAPYLPPIDFRVHGIKNGQPFNKAQLVPLGGQIDIYSTFSEKGTN